jgi:threonine synthase
LLVIYDYDGIRQNVSRKTFEARSASMWRYFEFLPVVDVNNVITFLEGWTPLLKLEKFGRRIGLRNVYLKDESYNPTLSFKARGISCAISKAVELKINRVGIPTAGNAGGALSAYCARAGIKCIVTAPRDTPELILQEIRSYGADLYLVDGSISDCSKFIRSLGGVFDMSTMREPYRLQGKKTIGFEIIEQLSWNVPDWIIYPTGGGTGLIGIWLAIDEFIKAGLIERKFPKMVAVQSSGCAPVVEAFRRGESRVKFWKDARTIAYGLKVPEPFAGRLILEILDSSGGEAISVDDSEIIQMQRYLAKVEGILSCPEGSATAVALEKLVEFNKIKDDDIVVIFNTASGIKYFQK